MNETDNFEKDYALAKAIATVDGVESSEDAKTIMKLYYKGEIDYETACSKIKDLFISVIPESENDIEIISKTKKEFLYRINEIRIDNI